MLDATPAAITLTYLSALANDARKGLLMVAEGEDKTMDGWLFYGEALNAGRKLHRGDLEFGQWVRNANLAEGVHDHDRAAAMWATDDEKYPGAFDATRKAHPKVRTVRGLHAKWKEAQRPAPKTKPVYEEPTEADERRMELLRNTINHPSTETHLRANAQAKLNEYLERFGMKEDPKPKQQLNMNQLVAAITRTAAKKCTRSKEAFDILEFAIHQTYGSSVEDLEELLAILQED